jgi:hypothetical protein
MEAGIVGTGVGDPVTVADERGVLVGSGGEIAFVAVDEAGMRVAGWQALKVSKARRNILVKPVISILQTNRSLLFFHRSPG